MNPEIREILQKLEAAEERLQAIERRLDALEGEHPAGAAVHAHCDYPRSAGQIERISSIQQGYLTCPACMTKQKACRKYCLFCGCPLHE